MDQSKPSFLLQHTKTFFPMALNRLEWFPLSALGVFSNASTARLYFTPDTNAYSRGTDGENRLHIQIRTNNI